MPIETRTRWGWKLELSRTDAELQNASDDPGQYTPVMVVAPNGATATGDCALNEGYIEGYGEIPTRVWDWLEEQIDAFWQNI